MPCAQHHYHSSLSIEECRELAINYCHKRNDKIREWHHLNNYPVGETLFDVRFIDDYLISR